ncbi:MAG: hypothetical protein HZT40_16960 [Candidatus Thiothrix singaporensis]|uniref:Uncharacterized protein n=1 Tax=Candidatus Thiothrix singaporensis TaxID=2799669 RepID=A0A7L6AV20_9GAMM|nr:MAG: hypothetical protein HZT40_16960 [Candidatus Thiothrix singaporensis]
MTTNRLNTVAAHAATRPGLQLHQVEAMAVVVEEPMEAVAVAVAVAQAALAVNFSPLSKLNIQDTGGYQNESAGSFTG